MSTAAVFSSDCNVAKIAFGLDLQTLHSVSACFVINVWTAWRATAWQSGRPRAPLQEPPGGEWDEVRSRQSRAAGSHEWAVHVWYHFPKQSAFIAFPPGVLLLQSALQRHAMYQEIGNHLKKKRVAVGSRFSAPKSCYKQNGLVRKKKRKMKPMERQETRSQSLREYSQLSRWWINQKKGNGGKLGLKTEKWVWPRLPQSCVKQYMIQPISLFLTLHITSLFLSHLAFLDFFKCFCCVIFLSRKK